MIFDLDGVVLSSSMAWQEINQNLFAHFQIQIKIQDQKAILQELQDLEIQEALGFLSQSFKIPKNELEDYFYKESPAIFVSKVFIDQGVSEGIARLRQHGIRCGVATASFPIFYQPILEKFQLEFDVVVDTQMVGKSKCNADVYLQCLQALGNFSPHEALVIEDSLIGIESAKTAGFQTLFVADEKINWSEINEKCFNNCRK